MSEKELREFAKETAGQYAPPGVRQLCRDLLADEPDVVKVLRWLKDQERALPLNTPVDADWYAALKLAAKHIEQTFGIRLTDDGGWEYVGERNYETGGGHRMSQEKVLRDGLKAIIRRIKVVDGDWDCTEEVLTTAQNALSSVGEKTDIKGFEWEGSDRAAHAIAERLGEGVVWEGLATARTDGHWDDELGTVVFDGTIEFDEIAPGFMLNVPDGQRVRVTVEKVEGKDAETAAE
jgi:hypothetical protein